jgi:2'-hydroxyisoflavone reductase
MNIAVIGGTRFFGRRFVEAAARRGDRVTAFHRGENSFELPAGVNEIHGDRDSDALNALAGPAYDLVLDTCGYYPVSLERSTAVLKSAKRYLFISSISAYADASRPGLDESSALAVLADGLGEKPDVNEHYGALKAACENVVRGAFGDRATIVRPGLIVGAYDPTDRFTYWPERMMRGGEVLAPGSPSNPVQFIDARDLAEFCLTLADAHAPGAYNATGPARTLTMEQFLACGAASLAADEPVRLRWIGDRALLEAGVTPWSDLPLWIPENDPETGGLMQVDVRSSIAAGLRFHPLEDTLLETALWSKSLPPDRARKAGLSADRERELLGAPAERP